MKEMTIEELKAAELDILCDVARFCEQHNLTYFLAYGTLIGAVRHKGFIPWDDDVDVFMPRKDYEVFKRTYGSERYRAVLPVEKAACHTMVKVVDEKTVKIEPCVDYKNGYFGVDIDVFPLDGEPSDEKEYRKWYKKLLACYKKCFYLSIKPIWGKKDGLYSSALLGVKKVTILRNVLFSSVLHLFGVKKEKLLKKAEALHRQYPYEESEWVGSVEMMFNSPKNRFKKTCFESSILVDFEDKQLRIPVGYDEVLTAMYGDYMQLPPEAQQATHHINNCFWRDAHEEV